MRIEKRLAKHLRRLNRAIKKIVAHAPEFSELRKLLREEQVELAIYVVPLVGGKSSEEMDFKLTESDRAFLKQAGIRFEA
ncbi:MAG TPA: hypothetical protein VGB20_06355 [bacterium]